MISSQTIKRFIYGWIVVIGLISMAIHDQSLFGTLVFAPVMVLLSLAVVGGALTVVARLLR